MAFNDLLREDPWDINSGENIEEAKNEILSILRKQKVSISKTRALFSYVLTEIEKNNPIII